MTRQHVLESAIQKVYEAATIGDDGFSNSKESTASVLTEKTRNMNIAGFNIVVEHLIGTIRVQNKNIILQFNFYPINAHVIWNVK